MRIRLLAFVSLLCASSAQATWQDTNARFWQAVESRDLVVMRSVLTGSLYDDERSAVLDVLSAFDAMSISEVHFDSIQENRGAAFVEVAITGQGHLRGGSAAPLPSHWTLSFKRFKNDWRIDRIALRESAIADDICPPSGCDADRWPAARADISSPVLLRLVITRLKRELPSRQKVDFIHRCREFASNRADEALVLMMLARSTRAIGDWSVSRDQTCEALQLAREIGDAGLIAAALLEHALSSDGTKFEKFDEIQEALRIAEAGERPDLNVELLLTEGTMAGWLGRWTEALNAQHEAERLALRIEHAEFTAIARYNIAKIYQPLGYDEIALQYFRDAYRSLTEQTSPYRRSAVLTSLSLAELTVHHPREAEAAARKALEVVGPAETVNRFAALFALAYSLDSAGHHIEAQRVMREGIPICRHLGGRNLAEALVTGAEMFLRTPGNVEEAETDAHEAMVVANPDDIDIIVRAQSILARVLRLRGDNAGAKKVLIEAVANVESLRHSYPGDPVHRAGFFRGLLTPYRELTAIFAREGDARTALDWSERMRAREVDDNIASRKRGSPPVETTDAEQSRRRELNQRVVDLNRSLVAANFDNGIVKHQLNDARENLEAFDASIAFAHGSSDHTDANDVTSLTLPRQGTIIEFAILDRRIVVFVIHNGNVRSQTLSARPTEVEAMSRNLLSRIETRRLDYPATARRLYDLLIAPLALPRGGRITIIADSFLWSLPFQVLRDRDGKYLAERYAVTYAPSLAMLNQKERAGSRNPETLLALGDPLIASKTSLQAATYRNLGLGGLPDAREEVRAIGDLYGRDHSEVLTGADARESALKTIAGRYRIVHLATHGIVDDDSPLYSALVLATAKDDPDDGLLEMREIQDLQLNADLVVLSACDTARGKVYPGEGVVGLSWAFLSAGCPTTVVTQWKANSKSTSLLMIEFHRQIVASRSVAEALRRAESKIMKTPRYRHPFYWAPFIVVGQGDSMLGAP